MKDYLSVNEAAVELKVHRNTVDNWVRRGILVPDLTLSGTRLFSTETIEEQRKVIEEKNMLDIHAIGEEYGLEWHQVRYLFREKNQFPPDALKGKKHLWAKETVKAIMSELGYVPPRDRQEDSQSHENARER